MKKKLLVTSYKNPDLDGTACAIGYAEYLNKNNEDAIAAIFGLVHREAEFVLKTFNIPKPDDATDVIKLYPYIILVDASDTHGISSKINPIQVVEIIDHRKIHEAEKFPNAHIQIEQVGSAATLITEKFYTNKVDISHNTAVLLYSAIVSNTINFQADVTTNRDIKMAEWLLIKIQLPYNYIHSMFYDKSQITVPILQVFEHDFAIVTFKDRHIGILQLEIINVHEFITKRSNEINDALRTMKSEKKLDYIFLTAIDLEKATNTFVIIDADTQKLVEESLHVRFKNSVAYKEGIIMRKSITPLIKECIENR